MSAQRHKIERAAAAKGYAVQSIESWRRCDVQGMLEGDSMTDRPPVGREALAAALEFAVVSNVDDLCIVAAARERLAQLPEKCETCEGKGWRNQGVPGECPACHGRGVLYPPALVERIAATIYQHDNFVDGPRESEILAVAVLDALNGETE
jgi:hypothetical protein